MTSRDSQSFTALLVSLRLCKSLPVAKLTIRHNLTDKSLTEKQIRVLTELSNLDSLDDIVHVLTKKEDLT